ncbi:MAG TPA: toll/interleukin-1 receptor domain-containing protein, partial [Pyrinomonadaceae bacterium]|nr:toll/interleukin-1 receptor domain-containing protein [Pyrinomonadaceae bacterium]
MTVDVAAAAREYLPTIESLIRLLAAAESRPISRSDLDDVWVRLPQAGTIASAELFRTAIKMFEEVIRYEYLLRNEIDASPHRVLDVSREVHNLLAPIVESKPKPSVLMGDPGVLDRYFYALSNLGELIGAIASIEYERIKAGSLVRQLVGRLKTKLEGVRNAFEWLSAKDEASIIKAPEAPGWWAPGGAASAVARDTTAAERTWMKVRSQPPASSSRADPTQYDAFISHAAEDKKDLVRPLAKRLRELGFSIWYDEFELKVGDSLRRSIDRGLANSRFGIVVLSIAFFSKNWPQYELDGLVTKELSGGKVILPLWHKVSKDEVVSYSPSLADKLA